MDETNKWLFIIQNRKQIVETPGLVSLCCYLICKVITHYIPVCPTTIM